MLDYYIKVLRFAITMTTHGDITAGRKAPHIAVSIIIYYYILLGIIRLQKQTEELTGAHFQEH